MSEKSAIYEKLAESVEALEALGLEIEVAEVEELVEDRGQQHPLSGLFEGPHGNQEVFDAIHIVARIGEESPLQTVDDPPDNESGVDIEVTGGEEEATNE